MESQLPFLLLIAFVFLFFIVIPQSRRNKKEKNYLKITVLFAMAIMVMV